MARKPSSKKLVELAKEFCGVKTDIAAACGVTRQSVHNWMQKDESFRKAMNDPEMTNDLLVDMAVKGLKHHLENNSERSIHYTLDRLARGRGFGQFITTKTIDSVENKLKDMTEEELMEYWKNKRKKIAPMKIAN